MQATKEAFEAARALTKKLQSKEAALVGAQVTSDSLTCLVFVRSVVGEGAMAW